MYTLRTLWQITPVECRMRGLIRDYSLVGLIAVPLFLALGLVIYSRRYFGDSEFGGN